MSITPLSPHFTVEEAFPSKCNRDDLAVSFDQALQNATFLATAVLEPVRTALNSPLGVNSWARDRTFNVSLAGKSDPMSANRAASRPGPHCYGSAADVRVIKADKLGEIERNAAYLGAFTMIYRLTIGYGVPQGLPIHEAIIEYGRDNVHITHIHLQSRASEPARRFVARKWKANASGVLCESYERWSPTA
jgi:hypothetical protein